MRYCFVSHTAQDLLGGVAGGAERQMTLIAQGLVRRGHHVDFVATGYAGDKRMADGIHLQSAWDLARGPRGVRAVTYRFPALWRRLVSLRADVYYSRGFSLFAPVVVRAAHSAGAVSLVGLAHDTDLSLNRARERGVSSNLYHRLLDARATALLFREFALRRCDAVLAQTSSQIQRCHDLGLSCWRMPNLVPSLPDMEAVGSGERTDVIWIANLARKKGLEELTHLAAALAEAQFEVIGRVTASCPPEAVARLQRLPNVTLVDTLPHHELMHRLAGARVAANTSPSEGFSNVMLEAWALGVPVVSLQVDPDGLLSRPHGFGQCAHGNLHTMAEHVRAYLDDDLRRTRAGERGRQYVRACHSEDRVIQEFSRVAALCASRRRALASSASPPIR